MTLEQDLAKIERNSPCVVAPNGEIFNRTGNPVSADLTALTIAGWVTLGAKGAIEVTQAGHDHLAETYLLPKHVREYKQRREAEGYRLVITWKKESPRSAQEIDESVAGFRGGFASSYAVLQNFDVAANSVKSMLGQKGYRPLGRARFAIPEEGSQRPMLYAHRKVAVGLDYTLDYCRAQSYRV